MQPTTANPEIYPFPAILEIGDETVVIGGVPAHHLEGLVAIEQHARAHADGPLTRAWIKDELLPSLLPGTVRAIEYDLADGRTLIIAAYDEAEA